MAGAALTVGHKLMCLAAVTMCLLVEPIIGFYSFIDAFNVPYGMAARKLSGRVDKNLNNARNFGSILSRRRQRRMSSTTRRSSSSSSATESNDIRRDKLHTIDGVTCREVINYDLPLVDTITVLEATAQSQEDLVDEVLLLEDELVDDDDDDDDDAEPKRRRIQNGDPYGAVLWPASWAVAKYLLDEEQHRRQELSSSVFSSSSMLSDLHVVEIGTGTGLVSLALAKAGVKRVVATDYEPLPLKLVEYASSSEFQQQQQQQQHQTSRTASATTAPMTKVETQLFDICDFDTPIPTLTSSTPDDQNDYNKARNTLVVAADIMYEPLTGKAMARRVLEALERGSRVVVGDSPGRAGRSAFLQELNERGLPPEKCTFNKNVVGRRCIGPRHDLICGKGSTSVVVPAGEEELDGEIPNMYQELSVAILDLEPSVLTLS